MDVPVWLALMVHQVPLANLVLLDQMAQMANLVLKDLMDKMLKNLLARKVIKVQQVQLVNLVIKEVTAKMVAKASQDLELELEDQVNLVKLDPMDQSAVQELKDHQGQTLNIVHAQVAQEVVVVVPEEMLQAVVQAVVVMEVLALEALPQLPEVREQVPEVREQVPVVYQPNPHRIQELVVQVDRQDPVVPEVNTNAENKKPKCNKQGNTPMIINHDIFKIPILHFCIILLTIII